MTLKQLRRQAAQNGQTGREPADLRARLPDDFPNETTRNPQNRATQYSQNQQTNDSPGGSCECWNTPPLSKK